MAEHGFTPGEWVARADERDNGEWEVVKFDDVKPNPEDPWFIAVCFDSADGASAEANARLMAASPTLLEALEQAAADLRRAATLLAKHGEHDAAAQCDQREERARAAITLATGKDA